MKHAVARADGAFAVGRTGTLYDAELCCHAAGMAPSLLVNRARIRQLYDERFCRMWELYLLGCEMQFRHLNLAVFQLHLAREVDGVPLTRDYQFAQETPSTAGAPVIKFGAPVRAP